MFGLDFEEKIGGSEVRLGGPIWDRILDEKIDFKFVIGPEPAWKNVSLRFPRVEKHVFISTINFSTLEGVGGQRQSKFFSFLFSTSKIILVEFLNRF